MTCTSGCSRARQRKQPARNVHLHCAAFWTGDVARAPKHHPVHLRSPHTAALGTAGSAFVRCDCGFVQVRVCTRNVRPECRGACTVAVPQHGHATHAQLVIRGGCHMLHSLRARQLARMPAHTSTHNRHHTFDTEDVNNHTLAWHGMASSFQASQPMSQPACASAEQAQSSPLLSRSGTAWHGR